MLSSQMFMSEQLIVLRGVVTCTLKHVIDVWWLSGGDDDCALCKSLPLLKAQRRQRNKQTSKKKAKRKVKGRKVHSLLGSIEQRRCSIFNRSGTVFVDRSSPPT